MKGNFGWLTVFLVLNLLASGRAQGEQFVTYKFKIQGTVYLDKNGNGVHDADEQGIPGIGVSDGKEVVLTDKDGKFELLNADSSAQVVFVSIPRDYQKTNQFYYSIDTLTTEQNFDFGLQPAKEKDKKDFRFVQVTDIHINGPNDEQQFVNCIKELNGVSQDIAFIMATGDEINKGDYTYQFESYLKGIKTSNHVWYSLFGNHDVVDWFHLGTVDFARNYRHYIGPDYYSFDYSDYHFIILDSIKVLDKQKEWLKNDLAILGKWKKLIVFQHYPPKPAQIEELKSYGVKAIFTGHWHSTKITNHDGMLDINTPTFRFGGIDVSPAGYRIVEIKDDKIIPQFIIGGLKSTPADSLETINTSFTKPTTDWVTFKGSPSRLGISQDIVKPPFRLAWMVPTGGSIDFASPIIYNGVVYITYKDRSGLEHNGIVALDAVSGKELWRVKTDCEINHSATAYDGKIFVVTVGGTVLALDAKTGKQIWSVILDGDGTQRWIYAAPAVYEGNLYIGSAARLASLNPKTGEINWKKTYGSDWISSLSSPSLANGKFFMGAIWNDNDCFAGDVKTGDILWNYRTEGLHTSPVLADGKVYVADIGGKLTALSEDSGKEIWKFELGKGWSVTTPTVVDDMVIAASASGTVHAVNKETGQPIWQFTSDTSLVRMSSYEDDYKSVFSSPIVSGDLIYIGCSDGHLYTLNKKDGQKVWSYNLGVPVVSTPAISGNTLYFGAYDGNIYALTSQAK